jgi:hypothetical protein
VLQLHRGDRHACLRDSKHPVRVEIGQADPVDLAGSPQLIQPGGSLQPARDRKVPPVELDEVQALESQSPERLVDHALDIGFADARQHGEIGHEFCVHLDAGQCRFSAQIAVA